MSAETERCQWCWDVESVSRPATAVRANLNLCDVCTSDWDIPISPSMLERFRKDVDEYRCQPAWGDSVAVLHEIDRLDVIVAGLRAELARLRSAREGAADVERRAWSAKPGEPICNRMYSGEYWVAKTCIKVLGHDGGHADWYGRTWNQDERDGAEADR